MGNSLNLKIMSSVFCDSCRFPLAAREKSDVIVMKNGHKITCEVKGLNSNTLYISVDYILNTISADWTQVDRIDGKQLFLVKTQNGTVCTGMLSTPEPPSGRPVQRQVLETFNKVVTLDRKSVVSVNETSSRFVQRWNGQVGAGSSYTKGNESAQYNLNSDIGYVVERWNAEASYDSNLSSSTGAAVSTRNQLTLDARRLLRWNNWFATGLIDFLQSSVQPMSWSFLDEGFRARLL